VRKHHRDRRRLDEAPSPRYADHHALIDDRDRAERRGEQAHDTVAAGEPGDAGADLDDDPRALQAERTGLAGIHPERVEHVAEVEAGGVDRDAELPGASGASASGWAARARCWIDPRVGM